MNDMAREKTSTALSQRRRPKWSVTAGAPTGDEEQYFSRTILRALDILEAFDEEHPKLSLKDLSRLLGVPDASLFRMLITLQSRGYLHQNDDGSYQLANKVLHGKLSERAERFRQLAHRELQALAGHFNENASLAYLFGDRLQVIDSVDSLHEIRITNRPGRVIPPHCSAMGKAITAFQDREQIDRILETYGLTPRTVHSIGDRRQLISQLTTVRETGVAYDREESTLGGICIAAAIHMPDNRVVAAVSVSTPTARMTPEREKEIEASVFHTAQEISRLFLKSSIEKPAGK